MNSCPYADITAKVKIVSLAPFITETLASLGLMESVCGVTHLCDYPEETKKKQQITKAARPKDEGLQGKLSTLNVDFASVLSLAPDFIVTSLPAESQALDPLALQSLVRKELGESVKVIHVAPTTYEQILGMFSFLGEKLGVQSAGIALANRTKAQLMDWCDNFYERTKGKKITLLSGLEPLEVAGLWMPDLIHLTSAVSQHRIAGEPSKWVQWREVLAFAPDVIIVAPNDKNLVDSVGYLEDLNGFTDWEKVPAVKRGEVYFCDGKSYFNRPGPRILESMGILVSAIAGFESGYITPRDVFYKLRWVELHRHRFKK